MGARRGEVSRSGTKTFVAKPDLVSTDLIYPIHLTVGSTSAYGMSITGGEFAPLGQNLFLVKNSADETVYAVPAAGGPYAFKTSIRAANSAGTAWAAISAAQTPAPAYIELPDGTAAQGSKIWSGTGAPSSSTVGSASVGDYYFRRYTLNSAATLVAAETSTAGTTATSITVGSGSSLRSGEVLAGDLLLVCAENTVLTETCTVGSDVGITAASGDGGAKYNDGTRRIHMFSHVVQSGDISAGTVTASAFTNNAGNGRRLTAWVYRHDFGFPTTGSLHGCTLYASDNNSNTSITASSTRTVTGPAYASVSMCAAYASGSSTQPTFYWDSGSSTNKASDVPGAANSNAHISVKAGLGTNTSGATGYATGGSSCEVTPSAGTWGTLLGNWAINTTISTANILYVCVTAGSPGSWVQVM